MKVLVTGGAGFVGSFFVEEILRNGHEVRVIDILDPQVHQNGAQNLAGVMDQIEWVEGDVRDSRLMEEVISGMDAIVHLAAVVGVGQSMYEVNHYVDHNTSATAKLLELLVNKKHNVKKVVVASSMSIYGEGAYRDSSGSEVYPGRRQREQMQAGDWELKAADGSDLSPIGTHEAKPLHPTSIYAITKRDQEEMCLSIGEAYGIPSVALRFFNIYGPRQSLGNPYTGVAAIFSSRLMNGNAPVVFEDGKQSRDFIHVSDIVRAVRMALESDRGDGMALNVGTGQSTSVVQIAEVLAKRLGVDVTPEVVTKFREGDIRHCYADISRIQKVYGFEPKMSLEQGIDDLISWVRGQSAEDSFTKANAELESRKLTS